MLSGGLATGVLASGLLGACHFEMFDFIRSLSGVRFIAVQPLYLQGDWLPMANCTYLAPNQDSSLFVQPFLSPNMFL
jgi:hypothetical protein